MKRQAVFSCLTCTPSGDAGFCTACSLACHDGHDVRFFRSQYCRGIFHTWISLVDSLLILICWYICKCGASEPSLLSFIKVLLSPQVVELWTRRHFRCDCGNSKFGQGICKLQADKEIENAENTYNQNYKGLYCTCHRVYPDPEGEALGEMLQCCICEDWFHELHLGLPSSLQVSTCLNPSGSLWPSCTTESHQLLVILPGSHLCSSQKMRTENLPLTNSYASLVCPYSRSCPSTRILWLLLHQYRRNRQILWRMLRQRMEQVTF